MSRPFSIASMQRGGHRVQERPALRQRRIVQDQRDGARRRAHREAGQAGAGRPGSAGCPVAVAVARRPVVPPQHPEPGVGDGRRERLLPRRGVQPVPRGGHQVHHAPAHLPQVQQARDVGGRDRRRHHRPEELRVGSGHLVAQQQLHVVGQAEPAEEHARRPASRRRPGVAGRCSAPSGRAPRPATSTNSRACAHCPSPRLQDEREPQGRHRRPAGWARSRTSPRIRRPRRRAGAGHGRRRAASSPATTARANRSPRRPWGGPTPATGPARRSSPGRRRAVPTPS